MTRRKGVAGRRSGAKLKKTQPATITLQASAQERFPPYRSIEQVLGLYKPRKRLVTLRLDADLVEWFKKPGHGYQTRINKALRKVMREQLRKAEDPQTEPET